MSSDVYYKLYKSERDGGFITIVCMQWFDEPDYHEWRFVKDSSGAVHAFAEEEEAIKKLNEWYQQDEIDPEYRRGVIEHLIRE